jgi:hypothetical protein
MQDVQEGAYPKKEVLLGSLPHGTSCCCRRVNTVEKTLLRSLDQFSRLRFEISRLRLRFLAG